MNYACFVNPSLLEVSWDNWRDQRGHNRMVRFISAVYVKHKSRSPPHVVHSGSQLTQIYDKGDYLPCYLTLRRKLHERKTWSKEQPSRNHKEDTSTEQMNLANRLELMLAVMPKNCKDHCIQQPTTICLFF